MTQKIEICRAIASVVVVLCMSMYSYGDDARRRRVESLLSEKNPIALLNIRSVREDIGFTDESHQKYIQIRAKFREDRLREKNQLLGTGNKDDLRLLKEFEKTLILAESLEIQSFLTDAQWSRLRQLVYHMEIARVGLPAALAFGTLGEHAGITENQHSSLDEKGTRLEAELREKIRSVREVTHANVIKLLPNPQREHASELFGKFFEPDEPTVLNYRQMRLDRKASEIALPQANANLKSGGGEFEYLIYLLTPSVGRELQLDSAVLEKITSLNKTFNVDNSILVRKMVAEGKSESAINKQLLLRKQEFDGKLPEAIDELLLPVQRTRLKQLARYFVICRFGYEDAILYGFVAKELELTEEQKRELGPKIARAVLDGEKSEQIANKQFYDVMLKELSPEQRNRVTELLGPYIELHDSSAAAIRTRLLDKEKP